VQRRLSWLLAVSALGCADDLTIGNAFYEGGVTYDGSFFASDAGADAAQDAALAADAGAAQVDASGAETLIKASQALAGAERWLSQESFATPPASMRLVFQPALGGAQGDFVLYCPSGCLFSDVLRDPAQTANRGAPASVSSGRYALYHLADTGMVLGVLFDEEGRTIDLQFAWNNGPGGALPVEQIFLTLPLIGRLGFLPDRGGHN
jgi:hypothetical protein